jgi:hypothetical protein
MSKNPYAPKPPGYKQLLKDLPFPVKPEILEDLHREFFERQYDTRDPVFYRSLDDGSVNGDPRSYSLHGSDTSMEATLCQFWSGEHDNAFMSEYVCTLLNIGPSLIREVLELRKKVAQFEQGLPELAELKQRLEILSKDIGKVLP